MRVDTILPKLSSQHLYTHQYCLQKVSFETPPTKYTTFKPHGCKTPNGAPLQCGASPVGTSAEILHPKCPPGQKQIGRFLEQF